MAVDGIGFRAIQAALPVDVRQLTEFGNINLVDLRAAGANGLDCGGEHSAHMMIGAIENNGCRNRETQLLHRRCDGSRIRLAGQYSVENGDTKKGRVTCRERVCKYG